GTRASRRAGAAGRPCGGAAPGLRAPAQSSSPRWTSACIRDQPGPTACGRARYNSGSMSILKVARMGHPVLRAKARRLEKSEIRSVPIQRLIDDMIETMHEYHGVGLAAPQIHEGVRLFVASLDAGEEDDAEVETLAIVNPEITVLGSDVVEDWEGCLSIPDI